jgi:hypothetical protein
MLRIFCVVLMLSRGLLLQRALPAQHRSLGIGVNPYMSLNVLMK